MNYTRWAIQAAAERIAKAQICPHNEWYWAGIWEWCARCGISYRKAYEQGYRD